MADSFRLATARLIPRPVRAKPALVLAALILAGCGGSPHGKAQLVAGPGYRFGAPAGWHLAHTARLSIAAHDSELVQVSTFPLVRAYHDSMFDAVAVELQSRMKTLAKQVGGALSPGGTVTAAGIRSHTYDVRVGDHVDRYTFVLRGKREYQLLCRRKSSSGDDFCNQLVRTFEAR